MSELGDFLKAKRAAIAPESVGLPAVGNPRRVSGLRREEVAQLAAMSFDHPVVGHLELDWQALAVAADPDLTIIAFTAPAGSATADSLRLLGSWAAG